MLLRPIIVDEKQQELTQHGTEAFPVSMDRQLVSSQDIQRIPHWHYELQIMLVTEGSVIVSVPTGEYRIGRNEGIFINSCVLHEIVPTEEKDSVYICVNFHPNIIYGPGGSLIREDYVDPILLNRELPAIPLYHEEWQRKILVQMERMAQVEEKKTYGHELLMKIMLENIWYQILAKHRRKIEKAAGISFYDRQLITSFQKYIQKNYMQKVTLKDIAAVGPVSESECWRVFREVLNASPMAYLGKYRLSQSLKLLTSTSLKISEVAEQCGFRSTDYYIACFREEMGRTPLQYRKNVRKKPQEC